MPSYGLALIMVLLGLELLERHRKLPSLAVQCTDRKFVGGAGMQNVSWADRKVRGTVQWLGGFLWRRGGSVGVVDGRSEPRMHAAGRQ